MQRRDHAQRTQLRREPQAQQRDPRRPAPAPREVHHAHGRPPHRPPAPGPLLRHPQEPRRAAGAGRPHQRAHRRLPGHHRPRLHREHPGQRLQHGHRLPGLRPGPRQDHDLHPLSRARVQPAHVAVPLARERGTAAAQPHGQGRDGGEQPRAHGAASHLPGSSGL